MMRRNTLLPSNTPLPVFKNRRHRTLIETEINMFSLPQQIISLKTNFMHSESIARNFVQETLMNKIEEEMNQRELKKIVDQTMNQCISLFQNQNWQIDPKGPFNQRQKEAVIQLDEEPHIKRFDPKLGFNKVKKYKSAKVQTQTSLQFSRLKISSHQKQKKQNFIKPSSKNSIATHRTVLSKQNPTVTNDFPKLIPLKIDNNPNTPEGSYRRNLEDFLREKKINAEINLGYKMKYFDEKENNGLRNIQEFSKFNFLTMNSKNETFSGQNNTKLPLISLKEDCGMDYDGGFIPLKKITNSKKSAQILKTVYKIKNLVDEIKKPLNQKNKFESINIRPPTIRNESLNQISFSSRLSTQVDLKSIIEQKLLTNRIRFREMNENQQTTIFE